MAASFFLCEWRVRMQHRCGGRCPTRRSAVRERPPLRWPMQIGGARGLAAGGAGDRTTWRRCRDGIDGPVATGPYEGENRVAAPDPLARTQRLNHRPRTRGG
jgi:hypothetical protein